MALKIGTVLEPKYDKNVEHAIITQVIRFDDHGDLSYEVETIKSRQKAFMLPHEIYRIYEPIGQEHVGLALFSDLKSKVFGPATDACCECGKCKGE